MKRIDERWMLHGLAPQRYEEHKVRKLFRPLAERFVEYVHIRPGERLLDVACGTGIVARLASLLIGSRGTVTGIDLNPQMLTVAAACSAAEDVVIEWKQADAQALPFESSTFDTVLCQQGLQFFPEPARALREMHRVLVRGGRLGLNVWGTQNPYLRALSRSLRRYVSTEAAQRCLSPLALDDEVTVKTMLHAAGFRQVTVHVVTILRELGDLRETLLDEILDLPFASEVRHASDQARVGMADTMSAELQPYRSAGGYLIPVDAYVLAAVAE